MISTANIWSVNTVQQISNTYASLSTLQNYTQSTIEPSGISRDISTVYVSGMTSNAGTATAALTYTVYVPSGISNGFLLIGI